MDPVDTNGNGIADSWELEHFPGGELDVLQDSDGDGVSDLAEYYAGTDPMDADDVLAMEPATHDPEDDRFTLIWASVPGRGYRVTATSDLLAGTWTVVHGPVEAATGEYTMSWVDDSVDGVQRFYRVEVVLPPQKP